MNGAPKPPVQIPVDLPSRMPEASAAAMFVEDLVRALEVYGRDEAAGVNVANFAAFRAYHALGRSELAKPFRALMDALVDLKEGKPVPPLLKPGPPAEGNHKPRAEWAMRATASAFLHVLIKETKMQRDPAARAVAAILDKKGIKLGKNDGSTWKAIKSTRDRLKSGVDCPEQAAESFKEEVAGLTEGLLSLPYSRRRQALLDVLGEALGPRRKIQDSPPFNPESDGASCVETGEIMSHARW